MPPSPRTHIAANKALIGSTRGAFAAIATAMQRHPGVVDVQRNAAMVIVFFVFDNART